MSNALRDVSTGWCSLRAFFSGIMGLVAVVVGVVLLAWPYERRERVRVTVDAAESSHELRDFDVTRRGAQQERVAAVFVAGSSTETCTTDREDRMVSGGSSSTTLEGVVFTPHQASPSTRGLALSLVGYYMCDMHEPYVTCNGHEMSHVYV